MESWLLYLYIKQLWNGITVSRINLVLRYDTFAVEISILPLRFCLWYKAVAATITTSQTRLLWFLWPCRICGIHATGKELLISSSYRGHMSLLASHKWPVTTQFVQQLIQANSMKGEILSTPYVGEGLINSVHHPRLHLSHNWIFMRRIHWVPVLWSFNVFVFVFFIICCQRCKRPETSWRKCDGTVIIIMLQAPSHHLRRLLAFEIAPTQTRDFCKWY